MLKSMVKFNQYLGNYSLSHIKHRNHTLENQAFLTTDQLSTLIIQCVANFFGISLNLVYGIITTKALLQIGMLLIRREKCIQEINVWGKYTDTKEPHYLLIAKNNLEDLNEKLEYQKMSLVSQIVSFLLNKNIKSFIFSGFGITPKTLPKNIPKSVSADLSQNLSKTVSIKEIMSKLKQTQSAKNSSDKISLFQHLKMKGFEPLTKRFTNFINIIINKIKTFTLDNKEILAVVIIVILGMKLIVPLTTAKKIKEEISVGILDDEEPVIEPVMQQLPASGIVDLILLCSLHASVYAILLIEKIIHFLYNNTKKINTLKELFLKKYYITSINKNNNRSRVFDWVGFYRDFKDIALIALVSITILLVAVNFEAISETFGNIYNSISNILKSALQRPKPLTGIQKARQNVEDKLVNMLRDYLNKSRGTETNRAKSSVDRAARVKRISVDTEPRNIRIQLPSPFRPNLYRGTEAQTELTRPENIIKTIDTETGIRSEPITLPRQNPDEFRMKYFENYIKKSIVQDPLERDIPAQEEIIRQSVDRGPSRRFCVVGDEETYNPFFERTIEELARGHQATDGELNFAQRDPIRLEHTKEPEIVQKPNRLRPTKVAPITVTPTVVTPSIVEPVVVKPTIVRPTKMKQAIVRPTRMTQAPVRNRNALSRIHKPSNKNAGIVPRSLRDSSVLEKTVKGTKDDSTLSMTLKLRGPKKTDPMFNPKPYLWWWFRR